MRWDDIIGLDNAKRIMKEAVVYPIKVCVLIATKESLASSLLLLAELAFQGF